MNKKIIKPLVLVGVFIVSILIFNISMNRVNEDLTTSMSEASLPVMSFYYGDNQINELHGYVSKMDERVMRDSIIPIDSSRILPMEIATYGISVDKIHYEIRSMDGERLVAEADVDDYQTSGNTINADLKIQNLLEENNEYLLVFTLSSGSDSIYYYSRIIQTSTCNVGECLNFAREFNEKTFDKKAGKSFLPTFLETTTGDENSLNYVDLTCTLKYVMWADFECEVYGSPKVSFKEINESYNVITINYVVHSTNSSGETEFYNVEDYFRLRLAPTRMYVLNYERRMNQIFRGENSFITDDSKILLGIRDQDVEYKSNESGSVICFVQEGDLWCYNKSSNEIQQVFSFRSAEGIDARENWNQHDIKIIRVDEAGSCDFIVYGYMNRGDHEGQVGTAVYRYDGIAHTIEEEAFIPSDTSFEVLKAEMGQLMYENDKGVLYLLLQGNMYTLDLNTLKVKLEVSGLEAGCYAVSDSNKYIAWVEPDKIYASDKLYLMDIKTDTIDEIGEGSGKLVKPLGFICDDFIYGIANSSDVTVDAAGNTTFPMETLKILDTSEDKTDVIKEYRPSVGKVLDISVDDYTINVELTSSGKDTIMNREADTGDRINVELVDGGSKSSVVALSTKGTGSDKTKLIVAKGVLLEEDRDVEIKTDKDVERFYVYEKGQVVLATDSISDAISEANECMGVVADSSQYYIWMRARKTYADPLAGIAPSTPDENANDIVKCVSAMLAYEQMSVDVGTLMANGASAKEVISNTLSDAVVLDVSGCSAESIIFYVSQGSPVFAMTGNGKAVLVTGYSSTNIYYYDPSSNGNKTVTIEEADDMFKNGGRRFITYMKR